MTVSEYMDIYKQLDTVSPVAFDCGRICGAACCQIDEDLGIFLLPGEEKVRGEDQWEMDHDPDGRLFARCTGPDNCDRSTRPIQCRSFPLIPVIGEDGETDVLINQMELPYSCPLIESDAQLDPEFVRITGQVWRELVKDPEIKEIVKGWSELP